MAWAFAMVGQTLSDVIIRCYIFEAIVILSWQACAPPRQLVVAGAALGLATLVRPTTQFFILLAPVLLPLILIISKMIICETWKIEGLEKNDEECEICRSRQALSSALFQRCFGC